MKIADRGWYREVVYDGKRWELLRKKRKEALPLLELASRITSHSVLHGSVARGDVREESDVDVALQEPIPPYLVELEMERSGVKWYDRFIVQATPHSTPKLYYSLDPIQSKLLSLPLKRPSKTELEFYRFGGALSLEGLKEGKRVPGVDKRLVLIIPTEKGHTEQSILGREEYAAGVLGISTDTVKERVRVLLRRSEHGRTGVFLEFHIPEHEPTTEGIERLKSLNRMFRKVMEEY